MGTPSRYDNGRMDTAIDAIITRPVPVSLTDEELDLEHHRVTEASRPVPVRAWVRFHEATVRPRAEAIAWTDKAVKIRWTTHQGARMTAWVWASAVEHHPKD